MEVAEPEGYPVDPALEHFQEPHKNRGRRWIKHWVPHDTILGSGKCVVRKWITEDMLNLLQTKQHNVVEEEQEPEEEHEVVYLCTYEGCGKIFPEASGLRKHAHVHGEKQYICQYQGCGKFVDSSKLKRHFLIHTGEKHFICPFEGCGKAFSLDFNLRSHMQTHTGKNYHICPYKDCGNRYAHEYKLKAHMRSFHDKVCGAVEKCPPYQSIFAKLAFGESQMLDKAFYEEHVKRLTLVFEQQFHYAVFYAYMKLREQET